MDIRSLDRRLYSCYASGTGNSVLLSHRDGLGRYYAGCCLIVAPDADTESPFE